MKQVLERNMSEFLCNLHVKKTFVTMTQIEMFKKGKYWKFDYMKKFFKNLRKKKYH